MTMDVIYEGAYLIGHIKFLLWQQLDSCSTDQTLPLSAKGVACKTILYTSWSLK